MFSAIFPLFSNVLSSLPSCPAPLFFRFYVFFPVKTMFFLCFLSAFAFSSNIFLFSSSHSSFPSPIPNSPFSFFRFSVPVNLPLPIFLLWRFACVSSLSAFFSSLLFTGLVSSFAPLCPGFPVLLPHPGCISFPREGRGEKEHGNKNKGREQERYS